MHMNKQNQNEIKLNKEFKKQFEELKKLSHKPIDKQSTSTNNNENELVYLNKHYRFVREVSTSSGFPERGKKMSLERLILERLHQAVYKLLESECKSNLDKDLEFMEQEQKQPSTKSKTAKSNPSNNNNSKAPTNVSIQSNVVNADGSKQAVGLEFPVDAATNQ